MFQLCWEHVPRPNLHWLAAYVGWEDTSDDWERELQYNPSILDTWPTRFAGTLGAMILNKSINNHGETQG